MYTRAKYQDSSTWDHIPNPVATPKYDGASYFIRIDPMGTPQFISRRESVKGGFPDKSDRLPHLSSIPVPQLAGEVYHVELHHSGPTKGTKVHHAVVSGILNSLPAKAIETQRLLGPIRVALLDVISPKFDTYGEKLLHLKAVEKAFNKPDVIFTPDAKITREDIQNEIDRTKAAGEEGVVITSLTLPESKNVRLKIKHFKTYNLKVVGIQQERDIKGNLKDSAGALVLADGTGKIACNVGTGFTKEQRKEIWMNQKNWMNRIVQIKAMDSTANKLRFPVFNGDADGDIDTV